MSLVVLALVVILALLPLVLPAFYLTLMNFAAFSTLVVLGLYLLTGLARMTSFGQAAFMGVSAYTTALLAVRYGLSPWLGLFAGVMMAGAAAWVLGALTARLKGHFLPLATIAWQVSIYILMGNLVFLTGGHTGLTGVPPISVLGLELRGSGQFYYLAWSVVLLAAYGALGITKSRTGRAVRALRGDAVAAASFGVNPAKLKLRVFVLAAAFAGLAGWLYAHFFRFVNPTPFSLESSIVYLMMGVVGGIATLPGVFIGAALITGLEHWLQDILPAIFGRTGNYEIIAFGFILVLILHRAPRGLWAFVEGYLPKRRAKPPTGEGLAQREKMGAPGEALLEIDQLRKAFGGLIAVNNMSFQVRRGEILGLIGPNGAGKTTCFNLITGVYPPTAGEVRYRGEKLSGLQPFDVAKRGLARTFQHPHLFAEMTVLENAALGTYGRTRAGIVSSMLRLDHREERRALAEAYKQLTRVGLADVAFQKAGGLPLGKQRLLEIARALAADPELLLLDEPGAGLRAGEKAELAALVRRLAGEGITVLFVDHDMDLVMGLVDRVVVMHYGERLAEGSPKEVQANPQVVEAYLGGVV
jgi:branched-chain amino acid transport system permease protein